MIIAIFAAFLSISSAHAQKELEPMFATEEGKYGEERSRGDLAASEARTAFEFSVCIKSVKVFCPKEDVSVLTTLQDCLSKQLSCHAMRTTVATRFISKYGKGADSAEEQALPGIVKLLEAFEDFRFTGKNRWKMVKEIAAFSGVSVDIVKDRLINVMARFDEKRPPTLSVDYWGYFQQWSPQRPIFTYREDGTLDTVMVAFRFCGMPLKFVPEWNFARDVFAQAIFTEKQLPHLSQADDYRAYCDYFEKKWRGSKKY